MKLNIIALGATVEVDGEVLLVFDKDLNNGEMPVDCVAVFMDSESWKRLKEVENE